MRHELEIIKMTKFFYILCYTSKFPHNFLMRIIRDLIGSKRISNEPIRNQIQKLDSKFFPFKGRLRAKRRNLENILRPRLRRDMSASRRDKTSNLVQNGFEWLSLRQRPGFENYGDVNYEKINIHHLWKTPYI